MSADKWTLKPAPRPDARLTLVCLHHAGGGAYSYRAWGQQLRPDIELVAIQLPGRENRASEPLLASVEAALDGIVGAIEDIARRPYALFGHSLGAVLAYLTARRLSQRDAASPPTRLFLSSAIPPARSSADLRLPPSDASLIRRLGRLGGTPAAVLDDPRMLRAFLPALRADFELLRQCVDEDHDPLPVPFTLLRGRDDKTLDIDAFQSWGARSAAAVEERLFPGGHFYIQAAQAKVVALVNAALEAPPA
ncbi:MAG TPA: alpha/beta fold hydrolase [Caulobacteraceae bacterium]